MFFKLLCILVMLTFLTNYECKRSKKHKLRVSCESEECLAEQLVAETERIDALAYLERFGYLQVQSRIGYSIPENSMRKALLRFQKFSGIPATGLLDSLTLKYMKKARCGNEDIQAGVKINKRFALEGSSWEIRRLTYRLINYPKLFSSSSSKRKQVDREVEKAFSLWSSVTNLSFQPKTSGSADIEIKFVRGAHGDGDPFDGPRGILAHAYFPRSGGDIHFDDDEYWTTDTRAGTNLCQVITHELGHSLGLAHSSVKGAIMAPYYSYKSDFKLHIDDINGIQTLYGKKYTTISMFNDSNTLNTSHDDDDDDKVRDGDDYYYYYDDNNDDIVINNKKSNNKIYYGNKEDYF